MPRSVWMSWWGSSTSSGMHLSSMHQMLDYPYHKHWLWMFQTQYQSRTETSPTQSTLWLSVYATPNTTLFNLLSHLWKTNDILLTVHFQWTLHLWMGSNPKEVLKTQQLPQQQEPRSHRECFSSEWKITECFYVPNFVPYYGTYFTFYMYFHGYFHGYFHVYIKSS